MAQPTRLVLITTPLESALLERVQERVPEVRIEQRPGRDGELTDEAWGEVEVLYTLSRLPAPEQAPRLRWVQLHSAGADRLPGNPLFQREIAFTTASGVHAVVIAEYVLMMTIAWFHRLSNVLSWQQRRQWPPNRERWSLFVPRELRGMTMGIVGYGSIGRQVARLAQTFGMRVLAMQRGNEHRDGGFVFPGVGDPEGDIPERYYPPDHLHEMLGECDVVVIALPLTSQTRELFDAAAFAAMKREAFLVNIARGEICDEEALIQALKEQRIAGAALDVFRQEPLPAESPLWTLPNVLLSPHISGFTPAYDERVMQIFSENLRRYLAGEPLYNLVDKQRGY